MVAKAVLAVLIGVGALLALAGQAVGQEPPGGPPPATTETGAPPETQPADTALLPVDALVDSDTPIEGARIRVLDRDGQPIKQVDGTAADRTNDNGVAVLEFPDLPGRFTVTVSGGRANGDRFDGTLRTEVEGYDSTEGDVVLVDPVSTIAAADGVTLGEAKRLLGIPHWFSDTDFLFSDTYFDADAFLRAADRANGVDALIDGLVDKQRADDSAREPFRAAGAAKATAAGDKFSDWAALAVKAATGNWQPLAKKAFATLLNSAVARLPNPAKGVPVLGWVMKQLGVGGKDEDNDKEAIKEVLGDIGKAIAGLNAKADNILAAIEKGTFNGTYASTSQLRVRIDNGIEKLIVVSGLSPGDKTAVAEQNQFKANVEKWDLAETGAAELNEAVLPAFKKATGIIAGASRLAKAEDHPFFDTESSNEVESALGFFALYQLRLAIVVAEYKHLTGANAESSVNQIDANVANQAKALKPTVPAGAFIDTRTNKMWTQSYTPNPMPANTFFRVDFAGGRGTPTYPSQFDVKLPGMDFADWALPSKRDFQGLIQDRAGRPATDFLRDKARMSAQQVNAAGGKAFMARPDGWTFSRDIERFKGQVIRNRFQLSINRFDLANGDVVNTALAWCGFSNCKDIEQSLVGGVSGAVLFVRPLDKNESYWYK